jgi:hypothetical protein
MSRKPCISPLNSVYRKGWYTEKTLENFKNLFEGKLDEENLPVNNSLIDYPVKRYDRAFELASDVINENFTAREIWDLTLPVHQLSSTI